MLGWLRFRERTAGEPFAAPGSPLRSSIIGIYARGRARRDLWLKLC